MKNNKPPRFHSDGNISNENEVNSINPYGNFPYGELPSDVECDWYTNLTVLFIKNQPGCTAKEIMRTAYSKFKKAYKPKADDVYKILKGLVKYNMIYRQDNGRKKTYYCCDELSKKIDLINWNSYA